MRFQKLYRALLIMPYALPGFLSLLVWQGLLNDDFGVVNRVFHTQHPLALRRELGEGLRDHGQPLADVPLLLPRLDGSVAVDPRRAEGGGTGRRRRRVAGLPKGDLPLLLIVVAPLMIASFAFNFNNFGNIYLLTGGGPATNDQTTAAPRTSSSATRTSWPSHRGKAMTTGSPRDRAHHLLHRRVDFGAGVLEVECTGERAMSTAEETRALAVPRARRKGSWRRELEGNLVAPCRRDRRGAVLALPDRLRRLRRVQRRAVDQRRQADPGQVVVAQLLDPLP